MLFNLDFFKNALKSVVISLIFSLVSVLIFAFIISIFTLSTSIIQPVNCIIKVLSVFLGCLFSVKGEKMLIKGAIYGFFIIVANYLLFSLIGGSFTFSLSLLWELLLGVAIGALTSIIGANLIKAR